MAFNAAGIAGSVESLTPLVYLPGRQGSLQAEMLGATRRSGLIAYILAPDFESVLREVAAGTPVVVLLNLTLQIYPVWHYAVVVGYDLEQGNIVLRSGTRAREEMSLGFFEFQWQDGGHWAMLALPPGRLPATAREPDFAAAVAATERIGRPREARESYRALLERWPSSLPALFGLGNAEFALGDAAAAERAFRRATEAHPKAAAAFNNHAYTLAVLGRYDEAEARARVAVALGGPTQAEAQKTLEAILARRVRR
jgi:tetratricopeptide (TPR) repeat protein